MRDNGSATLGGQVPAPDPDDRRQAIRVAWALTPPSDGAPAAAVVRVTNHGPTTATVVASADRYRQWVSRHLRLMVPQQVPLRHQYFVAIAPGETQDLVVPVAKPHRRTVIDVSASALGQLPDRSAWLLQAKAS